MQMLDFPIFPSCDAQSTFDFCIPQKHLQKDGTCIFSIVIHAHKLTRSFCVPSLNVNLPKHKLLLLKHGKLIYVV